MLNLEDIIEEGLQQGASDIHIICGLKPVYRITKALLPSKFPVVTEDDIYGFYDFIVNGNVEYDEQFKKDRRLDCAIAYKDVILILGLAFTFDSLFNSSIPTLFITELIEASNSS